MKGKSPYWLTLILLCTGQFLCCLIYLRLFAPDEWDRETEIILALLIFILTSWWLRSKM
jgi:hypothetical protein